MKALSWLGALLTLVSAAGCYMSSEIWNDDAGTVPDGGPDDSGIVVQPDSGHDSGCEAGPDSGIVNDADMNHDGGNENDGGEEQDADVTENDADVDENDADPDGGPPPGVEVCNGIDDNGDGVVDEGCACQTDWATEPAEAGCTRGHLWASPDGGVFSLRCDRLRSFDGLDWSVVEIGPGERSYSMWGLDSANLFVGTMSGAVVRIEAGAIVETASACPAIVYALWGSADDDVYAACGDGLVHFDGTGWSAVAALPPAGFVALWGSSADDVYAVGRLVAHFDGHRWSELGMPGSGVTYTSVWGSSASDVYAVGTAGTIVHGTGGVWSLVDVGTRENLFSVWGSGSSSVFVVGYGGVVVHYDGSAWADVVMSTASGWTGVTGTGANDIFIVDYDGTVMHRCGSW